MKLPFALKNLLLLGVLIVLSARYATAQNATPITLAQDGKTSYTIALAEDAIPAEKTAAEQLQKYLQQVTGANFPVMPAATVSDASPQIMVGAGKRVRTLLLGTNWDALGHDGIVIKTVDNKLVLAGGRPRGTLYAVFQFLEESAGCRWWTPTENTIPHKSTLTVAPQNTVYVPTFAYREHYTTEVQSDAVFATIMRENGHGQNQSAEWGGHYSILGGVHTFSQLIPLEKYFKAHPEWYSDPTNNFLPCTAASPMPDPQNTDPCLSNPEVLAEVTKNALEWIAKNPDAGYISISQNDNTASYCRDAEDMKLIEAEGSPAAPLIKFVNAVAGEIHKKYPDIMVETLAYHYSEDPPKTLRPAPNVMIRLAPIAADFGHPLDSDHNADVRGRLKAWSQISQQLFVWNYITNFCGIMLPHPNWDGLAKDLRFFAANKVIGVFEQGDCYTNGVGDFVQMRTWVVSKLLWNPNLDQNQLMNEFMANYYGPAAPYLRRYIDGVENSYLSQNRGLSTFNQNLSFFTLDVTNDSIRLFQQAEEAVKNDPVLLKRVQRERLALDIAVIFRYGPLKRAAAREHKEFLGPKEPEKAMDTFMNQAHAFGVRDWQEGASFDSHMWPMRNALVMSGQFGDE